MTRNLTTLASTLAAAALLAACSTPVSLNEVPVETRTPTAGAADGAGAGGKGAGAASQSQVATVQAGSGSAAGIDAALAATGRVVYFDYDSFVVRDDGKAVIDAHAKALVANRGRKMVVEGHTDERGGREYNLALGQKRSEAVRRALGLLGVTDSQVEAVSFGKEKPAAAGNGEAALAQNRRAEIAYR